MLSSNALDIDVAPVFEQFARDGYARLGRLLSDEGIELLRERADDLMLGRVTYPGMFFQMDNETGRYEDLVFGRGYEGPSLNYRKIEKLEKDERFLQWIRNPVFEKVARSLISGPVHLYRAILMNKKERGGSILPWHQDGGAFWGLSRDPELQIWTALDDAPLNAGCVEVLPGTHCAGLSTPLGGVVPAAAVTQEARAPVALDVRAGEVILLHNYVWHRSLVNTTPEPRRAFSVCYMSASIHCMRKKRAPRSFFPVWT